MRIAIYGSRHQDDFVNAIVSLIVRMLERGDSIVIHSKLSAYLSETVGDAFSRVIATQTVTGTTFFEADLALSIGGDGTFLRTAQWIGEKEIPIIGVNTGHLGFLAPFTLSEAAQAIEDNCLETYRIISRSLLHLELPYGSLDEWPYALNEIAILKKDTASMICVDARVDSSPLAEYLCDGLIVSTPTGSTGYNLSVGGPIVQPGSPNLIISPIAAHSLTMRPLVIDNSVLLEMKVSSRTNSFRLSLDGRTVSLPCGTPLFISKAPFVIPTVCKPDRNFFATLREKLLWGATANNKGKLK